VIQSFRILICSTQLYDLNHFFYINLFHINCNITVIKERLVLFCSLCNAYQEISWKSRKHFDEENDPMFPGDFIAGINTPKGIATFHFKLEYWDLFAIKELDRAPKYDNYTPEDVMIRILSLKTSSQKGPFFKL
jgi:hypothetical protein